MLGKLTRTFGIYMDELAQVAAFGRRLFLGKSV